MTKELSALLDGELELHEGPSLWATMKTKPHLRETWQTYKLIGDALRDEGNLAGDITGNVMRGLHDEPIVVAPRPVQARTWSNAVMAMAASVAGIAVVGWLAVVQQSPSGEATIAQANRPPAAVVVSPVPPQGMQEYMLAHQANAPGLHLQGGTEHIRTVSAVAGNGK
jgi:sigma-E factor negative regulatory protein RseA